MSRAHILGGIAVAATLGAWRPVSTAAGQAPPSVVRQGAAYVLIPAGAFRMGCVAPIERCPRNELPVHDVRINAPFYLGRTELTTGAYKRFAAATHRALPADTNSGFRPNPGWADDSLPMVNVSFNDAEAYCAWAGGGLPTEAQWEYAARAGGDGPARAELAASAWFADNSGRDSLDGDALWAGDKRAFEPRLLANGNGPHRVALKRPNAFGLYDMLGNAVEYTSDWFDIAGYPPGDSVDPARTTPGRPNAGHAARGGHWAYPGESLRTSKRFFGADEGSPVGGFRCAMPAR